MIEEHKDSVLLEPGFVYQPVDSVCNRFECDADVSDEKLTIYAVVIANKALTISANRQANFWLEIPGGAGWIRFDKHSDESEFTPGGALFVASELRSGSDQAPYPVVQAQCVLWRQREALLSAANTLSFLLGQKRSG